MNPKNLHSYLKGFIIKVTKDFDDAKDLADIRLNCKSRLIKYNNKYVVTRQLFKRDLRDYVFMKSIADTWRNIFVLEDFLQKGKIVEYRPSDHGERCCCPKN